MFLYQNDPPHCQVIQALFFVSLSVFLQARNNNAGFSRLLEVPIKTQQCNDQSQKRRSITWSSVICYWEEKGEKMYYRDRKAVEYCEENKAALYCVNNVQFFNEIYTN